MKGVIINFKLNIKLLMSTDGFHRWFPQKEFIKGFKIVISNKGCKKFIKSKSPPKVSTDGFKKSNRVYS